jgi:hypothetical protein
MLRGSHPLEDFPSISAGLPVLITGGLPVGSGTLAEVDLDPKSLEFRWEI